MSEISFSDNFSDLSVHSGTNAGFQFEFHCERCNDKFRTGFVPYKSGRVSGWVGKAAGMFGGVLGNIGTATESMAESGYGSAHDEALMAATETAKSHFHRCARCAQYMCAKCWNVEKGLCLGCAPSAEVEIEAAKASGEVYAAGEKAALEGIQRGKKMDVKRDRQLVCPKCGTETKGAKFCPECGAQTAVNPVCSKCSAKIPAGSKFCPECGQKA
jgi:hypothetical protein